MTSNKTPPKDLLTVVGARPQFIKSAALTRALSAAGLTQWLVHTGQHPDDHMGMDFLVELDVPPPDARISPSQQGRSLRLADMIRGVAEQIEQVRPKAVLVYGDTDSTLAGALAAHHAGVTLVHVEAGLRSGDRGMPEEHNRIVTDQLSDILCTTGPTASEQLRIEGVVPQRILEVGDVMLDLALAAKATALNRRIQGWPSGTAPVLVTTLHRPSTVDQPELLQGALDALGLWGEATGGSVVFPIHPRTLKVIRAHGMTLPARLINPGPLGYLDMQSALCNADVVLTDSGGLQKEAWYQGTPAVILRDTTEWRELIQIGASVLFDPAHLSSASGRSNLVDRLCNAPSVPPVEGSGLFGEGQAAKRLLSGLLDRI